ncbi:hypothetical protein KZO96_04080 [Bifidobacterium pseudocatenulatum]|uniref:hypothetical protein n=1 Tax=Bifidobacterium TaxID=1678 RepID=UPI001CFD9A13|nr:MULTISPECIES: hypothetical protein [Bifidobacterium]MCB4887054.1 hypothetical protein [Bifidobacterium pseudocatenulatum]MDH7873048.1 hypothetical protein [Bifidobacterium catenulatum subsp. kashiwanohense]
MTQIKFDFGHPGADGIADLAGEKIHVVPTDRFRNGSRIVVRDSFEVRLDEHGTATVTVPPTDSTFAYEVTVGEKEDLWRFVRCVQVPDSTSVLNFSDLVEVDSATLTPVGTGNPLADIDQSDVDWAIQFINS